MNWVGPVLTLTLPLGGCAARVARQAAALEAPGLCGAPARVVVAEVEGAPELRTVATDALADGLAELGFAVLAPRRPPPAGRGGRLDWVFGGRIGRTDEGLTGNVEVHSLRENRTVWSITDTRPDRRASSEAEEVRLHMATAVAMFRQDVLKCRESGIEER